MTDVKLLKKFITRSFRGQRSRSKGFWVKIAQLSETFNFQANATQFGISITSSGRNIVQVEIAERSPKSQKVNLK